MLAAQLLFVSFVAFIASSYQLQDIYSAKCIFSTNNNEEFQMACPKATFAINSFRELTAPLYHLEDSLCSKEISLNIENPQNAIVIVPRGECSFDEKAKVAESLGFKALIVKNSNETDFPMGSSDKYYQSTIPVVMVKNLDFSSYSQIVLLDNSPESVRVKKNEFESTTINNNDLLEQSRVLLLSLLVISISCLVFVIWQTTKLPDIVDIPSPITSNHNAFFTFCKFVVLFIMAVLFVLVRLGTFRRLPLLSSVSDNLFQNYNHRETDELIFQALVGYVSRNISDYSLHSKPILYTLHLAKENYDHAVFHHPPFFVAFSAFLYNFLDCPLPLVPLILQVLSLGCIPVITSCLLEGSSKEKRSWMISILAILIFSTCPVAFLASQKFWIDNAALMTVTLSVAIFMVIVRRRALRESGAVCFLCGMLTCGGLALNTKITSLAVVPFFIFWLLWKHHISFLETGSKDVNWIWTAIKRSGDLFMGIIAGHLPWLYYYYLQTGRVLPSAWPSESMLEQYPFVREAMNKPVTFYFETLFLYSPLQFISVIFMFMLLAKFLKTVVHTLKKGKQLGLPILRNDATLLVFGTWPVAFLFGLTFLGTIGSGFQSRFMLPALPALAIMAAVAIESLFYSCERRFQVVDLITVLLPFAIGIVLVFFLINAVMCWYYGVLFAPYYADLEPTLWDNLETILKNSFSGFPTYESSVIAHEYMKQFGFQFN